MYSINELIYKYFTQEGIVLPNFFERRVDDESSAILYSLVREKKPKSVLEIGTWNGGTTSLILMALRKNKKEFVFTASELLDEKREETKNNTERLCGISPVLIGDITKNLDNIPHELDFLFVDTDHDLETTKWIVENIWPRVISGGIFGMHDWPVREVRGEIRSKEMDGIGNCWPETNYLIELIKQSKFPFKKLYWTYHGQGSPESGFWEKI